MESTLTYQMECFPTICMENSSKHIHFITLQIDTNFVFSFKLIRDCNWLKFLILKFLFSVYLKSVLYLQTNLEHVFICRVGN